MNVLKIVGMLVLLLSSCERKDLLQPSSWTDLASPDGLAK